MKAHKYWSLGALAAMIGTFYTGYKNMKTAHKYFACSSLLCMIMAIYSGHKMISGKSRKKKDPVSEEAHTINHPNYLVLHFVILRIPANKLFNPLTIIALLSSQLH